MAIDRTLELRPATIDIADNVDNILSALTIQHFGASDLTFTSDYEPYNENNTNDRISIAYFNGLVSIAGGVKRLTTQSSAATTTMFTLPEILRPSVRHIVLNGGSGKNIYNMVIFPDGRVQVQRYGITNNIALEAGTWLRIDATYIK